MNICYGGWWLNGIYQFLNIIDLILNFQQNNFPEGEPLKANIVLAKLESEWIINSIILKNDTFTMYLLLVLSYGHTELFIGSVTFDLLYNTILLESAVMIHYNSQTSFKKQTT